MGRIEVYNGEQHLRTEFAATHSRHGETLHYSRYGEHIRTEFDPRHPRNGEIDYFENEERVRTEFEESHPSYNKVLIYDKSPNARTEMRSCVRLQSKHPTGSSTGSSVGSSVRSPSRPATRPATRPPNRRASPALQRKGLILPSVETLREAKHGRCATSDRQLLRRQPHG